MAATRPANNADTPVEPQTGKSNVKTSKRRNVEMSNAPDSTFRLFDFSTFRLFLVGIAIGLAVFLGTALIEFAMLSSKTAARAEIAWSVHLAAWGRLALTHAGSVLPAMILVSLPISMLFARRGSLRPDAWHAGSAVVVAGILVAYGNAAVRGHMRIASLELLPWHTLVITGVAALFVVATIHWVGKTRLFAWYRGLLYATAFAGLIACVTAPLLFRGTPLSGPDVYRRSPAALIEGRHDPRLTGPPNVLFIVMDTVRADHVSHYAGAPETSPFLKELSDEGVTFDRALITGPATQPSHASMFTGLSVREHGVVGNREALDDDFETFAERASASGFQCVSFSCNSLVDAAYNFLQGFESVYRVWATHVYSVPFLQYWMERLGRPYPAKWFERDNGAAMVSFLAGEWIANGYDPDKPFLMFINYMEAHSPDRPPLSYRKRFLDAESVSRSYELEGQYKTIVSQDDAIRYALDPAQVAAKDVEIYRALYNASIRYMDDRIRELFALLRVNGMLDNTVVIITSDHGEGLGDHGFFRHSFSPYDSLIHVPLTIYVPRHAAEPRRVGEAVSTARIFDAICAAVSAQQCPDADTLAQVMIDRTAGQPVVAEVLGTPRGRTLEIVESYGVRPNEGVLRYYRALNDATTKYIAASDGSEEFYDIINDPGELEDISSERRQLLRKFSEHLSAWYESTPEFVPDTSKPVDESESQLEALRALGYVGS